MPIIEVPKRLREKVEARLAGTGKEDQLDEIVANIARIAFEGHNIYLSTACLHGQHDYCNVTTRADGTPKQPAQCKFCPSKCVCDCHI